MRQHELPIAKAAKLIREASGLSQRAAAKLLDISHIYLNSIENDKASPTVQIVERFFDVFGVDLYLVACCESTCNRMTSAEKINYRSKYRNLRSLK